MNREESAPPILKKSPLIGPMSQIFSYEGPFFIDLLTMLGNQLKMMTSNYPRLQKQIFRVYVELSQNVSNYAEQFVQADEKQKKIGVGALRMDEDQSHYWLTTKNLVKTTDANILAQRCEIINHASYENLKSLKRALRKSSSGYKLGARIGMLQARLISRNPLDFHIIETTRDFSYFKLTVKFTKDGEY